MMVSGAQSQAEERVLGFGGYGPARMGDTPAEVSRALGEPVQCSYLAGSCVCATLGEYPLAIVFVFGLDRHPGLDVVFTSSRQVVAARGLRVGDSVRRLRRLFPHVHRSGHAGYPGYTRYIVGHHRLGLLADVHRGHIAGFVVGRRHYLDYEEFCA